MLKAGLAGLAGMTMPRLLQLRADATAAVFATLARHVDPGQIAKVLGALPEGIRRGLGGATIA